MSIRKTSQASKEKWSSYISTIEESIQKLLQIQELLSWTNVSTIKSLNGELKNLSTFYSFLLVRRVKQAIYNNTDNEKYNTLSRSRILLHSSSRNYTSRTLFSRTSTTVQGVLRL